MATATKLWDGTRNLGTFTPQGVHATLEVHHCGRCGVLFAIDENFLDERREDHASWACPNGHWFSYEHESEKERLRREARQAQEEAQRARNREWATRDLLRHEERSHAATKGHLTRTRKRVAAGVCPHPSCGRHFENLERHIKSKHPDLAAQAEPARTA